MTCSLKDSPQVSRFWQLFRQSFLSHDWRRTEEQHLLHLSQKSAQQSDHYRLCKSSFLDQVSKSRHGWRRLREGITVKGRNLWRAKQTTARSMTRTLWQYRHLTHLFFAASFGPIFTHLAMFVCDTFSWSFNRPLSASSVTLSWDDIQNLQLHGDYWSNCA